MTIYINDFSLINALGDTKEQIAIHLTNNESGLKMNSDFLLCKQPTYLGSVSNIPENIPEAFSMHNTRNNQLLLSCFTQIQSTYNQLTKNISNDRIAVILGTSTSGIYEGELAVSHFLANNRKDSSFHYQQQRFSDPSDFLSQYLNIKGPSFTVSTACSSSARAILSGASMIKNGLIDIAIVGGADSLCKMTVNGFNALGALSNTLCTPFAHNRNGINIGEAAGLLILSKQPSDSLFCGGGMSSDAWHISAPHPDGIGARDAMMQALKNSGLSIDDIGYINLHGTGTPLNDSAESKAVYSVFKNNTPCSSTKHLTAHTLGSAGITELGISLLVLEKNLNLPIQVFNQNNPKDSTLPSIQFVESAMAIKKPFILSNSLAFGGNNISLIIGKNI